MKNLKANNDNGGDDGGAGADDVPTLDDHLIGLEARVQEDDHLDIKVWLRLLACSTQVEQKLRERLRINFGTTLPRFDYLAQLERHPEGLRMNVLSRYLMVSGGNVTALTDQLVGEGLVERQADTQDRRSWVLRLTQQGLRQFAAMAKEHEDWLRTMFAPLKSQDKESLYRLLGALRHALAEHRFISTDPDA